MDYDKIEKAAQRRNHLIKCVTYALLSIWALLVLFPFYWMVLTSVKSYGAYNSEWIPKLFTLYRNHHGSDADRHGACSLCLCSAGFQR